MPTVTDLSTLRTTITGPDKYRDLRDLESGKNALARIMTRAGIDRNEAQSTAWQVVMRRDWTDPWLPAICRKALNVDPWWFAYHTRIISLGIDDGRGTP